MTLPTRADIDRMEKDVSEYRKRIEDMNSAVQRTKDVIEELVRRINAANEEIAKAVTQ